jgi:hypothetical protein
MPLVKTVYFHLKEKLDLGVVGSDIGTMVWGSKVIDTRRHHWIIHKRQILVKTPELLHYALAYIS